MLMPNRPPRRKFVSLMDVLVSVTETTLVDVAEVHECAPVAQSTALELTQLFRRVSLTSFLFPHTKPSLSGGEHATNFAQVARATLRPTIYGKQMASSESRT